MLFWTKTRSSAQQNSKCISLTSHLTNPSNMTTRYAEHYRRSKDKFVCDVLLWTLTYRHTSVSWLAKTYSHHLSAVTGYRLEGLSKAVADRDGWRESIKGNRAISTPWWWWGGGWTEDEKNHKITFKLSLNSYNDKCHRFFFFCFCFCFCFVFVLQSCIRFGQKNMRTDKFFPCNHFLY